MASLLELNVLFGNGNLQSKMQSAIVIAAVSILTESPTNAARQAWAKTALSDTSAEAKRATKYILGANSGTSFSALQAIVDDQTSGNDAIVTTNIASYINDTIGSA